MGASSKQDNVPLSGPIDLRQRVAIVTGSARGIGRAIAETLSREGADVVACDVLSAEETAEACRSGRREGARARSRSLALTCDVTSPEQVAALVERTMGEFGRIDILVNNAGVVHRTGLEETTEPMWQRDVDVIMTGTYRMTQAVYGIMKERRYGKIVNIASLSARVGGVVSKAGDAGEPTGRSGPAYAAAKGGVLAFTKWVARAGAPYGIYCNAICPGAIDTEMTRGYAYDVSGIPLSRMGRPEDIAEAAVFLASPAANYITGQVLNVDGGMLME